MPNRQHMEQMTAGMTSYFLSISKLQASTRAVPAPAPSELSPVGSAILGECERLEFGTRVELLVALSQVHLSRSGDCRRRRNVDELQKNKDNVWFPDHTENLSTPGVNVKCEIFRSTVTSSELLYMCSCHRLNTQSYATQCNPVCPGIHTSSSFTHYNPCARTPVDLCSPWINRVVMNSDSVVKWSVIWEE